MPLIVTSDNFIFVILTTCGKVIVHVCYALVAQLVLVRVDANLLLCNLHFHALASSIVLLSLRPFTLLLRHIVHDFLTTNAHFVILIRNRCFLRSILILHHILARLLPYTTDC